MTLGDALERPQNNILLIRIVAASLVVFSHSFSITRGPGTVEPPAPLVPTSFGTIGVSAFFLLSGMLIARSYVERGHLGAFVRARVLRIYPGLIASVLFCALLVGPLFTNVPLQAYFANPAARSFIVRNATLMSLTVQSSLPGAFSANPLPFAVNDPLWTLPYELCMYGFVAVMGITGILTRRRVFAATAASCRW